MGKYFNLRKIFNSESFPQSLAETGLAGKPPVVPKSPTETNRQNTEINGAKSSGVSRSNSFTSDAGTQTPRIKAKAKLYFEEGGSASASEESLTDAVAKEELQREIE